MYRFNIPEKGTLEEKVLSYNNQLDSFLQSRELGEVYSLLGVVGNNEYEKYICFDRKYNLRKVTYNNGEKRIIPEQEIVVNNNVKKVEDNRKELYFLFSELGMVSINKTYLSDPSCIVVLGGSLNACYDRTQYAKKFIHEATRSVCALGCNRTIGEKEKTNPRLNIVVDTEFEALSESFKEVFTLREYSDKREVGDSKNSSSCIRTFMDSSHNNKYTVLECPSSKEDYRADTLDTLHFFEQVVKPKAEEQLLFITNPVYVNGQGITVAKWAFSRGLNCHIDIIGCFDDDNLSTVYEYSPARYCQDLLRILREIFSFKEDYGYVISK